MTDTTLTLGPQPGLARRLRLWLAAWRHRRTAPSQFEALSDHMLHDIGVPRDETRDLGISTLHDAMRYSG